MTTSSAAARSGRHLAGLGLTVALVAAGLAAPVAGFAAESPKPAAAAAVKPGLDLNAGMGALDKLLAKADATPDQSTKIKAIIFDAVMSLGGQAQAFKATAASFGKSLMAPRVNRADLESARVSAVADFDTLSKVMVKAIGDAADVLTPEQRAKLAASAAKKGG